MSVYPHGHLLRYTSTGCTCAPCRRAKNHYEAHRLMDKARGITRLVDPIGTRRRLQALACMGWTVAMIAGRIGVTPRCVHQWMRHETIRRTTAEKVAALYDEISMLVPEPTDPQRRGVSSCKTHAKRKGYAPPLAWDDDTIDDPKAKPNLGAERDRDIDPVVVQRILDGHKEKATKAEKHEVLRRWTARGGSLRQLTAQTGWKVERYVDREVA